MRRFLITVNGRSYEVEVEEVAAFSQAPVPQPIAPQPAPQAAPAPAPAPAAAPAPAPKAEPAPANAANGSAVNASGTKVNAPMPGKILSVKVGPGQAVKRGTVLMILEAMKMENEIQSPVDGTVNAIAVSEGVQVNAGELLAVIG